MADKKIYTVGGVELTEKNPGDFSMGKKDFESVLDAKGVTKEVRDVVKKAEEEITTEMLKVAGAAIIDQKLDSAEVRLGTGDGSMKVNVIGRQERTVTNPKTGEKTDQVNYGVATIKIKKQLSQSIQEGVLADIQADCEKAFAKKK